jgi:hypothetical protein
MQPKPAKDQNTYLHEMLESAKQAAGYVAGMSFEQFWDDQKARDAVAMRLTCNRRSRPAQKRLTLKPTAPKPKPGPQIGL